MNTNLLLTFPGTCREAFGFYEQVFATKRELTMTFGDTPGGSTMPPEMNDLVMHTAMPLGSITLMGSDSLPEYSKPMGGFQVAVTFEDEPDVHRVFAALSEGGSVQMALAPTFWTPLFGMCTDKFGVPWMLGVPGPQQ